MAVIRDHYQETLHETSSEQGEVGVFVERRLHPDRRGTHKVIVVVVQPDGFVRRLRRLVNGHQNVQFMPTWDFTRALVHGLLQYDPQRRTLHAFLEQMNTDDHKTFVDELRAIVRELA